MDDLNALPPHNVVPPHIAPLVAEESFWDSKTMRLIIWGFAAVMVLVIMTIAAEAVFDVSVDAVIGGAIASITALVTGGAYRNTKVDGPIRMMQAGMPPGSYLPQTQPPTVTIESAREVNAE